MYVCLYAVLIDTMTRQRATDIEKLLIRELITLFEQGDVQGVDKFVERHGTLTNFYISEESGLYMHHPVLHKVIKHGSVERVQRFLRDVEFDPEDDPLVATAIVRGDLDIVRAVIGVVPSAEHWEFMETAKRIGNLAIITEILCWATET